MTDHLSKLIFPKFVSPLAAAKNYTILKATGSKEVVNILGRTDGSGQYWKLKEIEAVSARKKNVTVHPADVHIVADNEQVLSKNYRLFGSEVERKLHCNVINNWAAMYFL